MKRPTSLVGVLLGISVLAGVAASGPASANETRPPSMPSASASDDVLTWVKGSNLRIKNDTNRPFEIRTTSGGGDADTPEYFQAVVQPGLWWGDRGNNAGNVADVNARIYVDGVLRAVIKAGNPSIGMPWVKSRSGVVKHSNGEKCRDEHQFELEQNQYGHKDDYGLKFECYRGSDSPNDKQFTVRIHDLPTERAVDRTNKSGGGSR